MKPDEVKQWRESFNLNMREASDFLDVPYNTYRNWENGTREIPRVGASLIRTWQMLKVFSPTIVDTKVMEVKEK